ncbi:MAG TPA: cation transporter, partial [Psychromonas sp.]
MSDCGCGSEQAEKLERKALITLLSINGFMFVAEIITGWIAQSTGLIADSLDMLADGAVYALSLYV